MPFHEKGCGLTNFLGIRLKKYGRWNQFKFFVGKGLCRHIIIGQIVFQKKIKLKNQDTFFQK